MADISGMRVGKFELIAEMARGGMAAVYFARDLDTGRHVAVKVLPSDGQPPDAERVRRFKREAEVLMALDHPNILPVYDAGYDRGGYYMAAKYMPYGSLKDEIDRLTVAGLQMRVDDALDIGIQIAGALAAAHVAGLVHRDVKPSNILLGEGGAYFLSDFGVALKHDSTRLTAGLGVMGTAAYMSPEQIDGDDLDGRSDVYSLSVVLFELLTGRLPFDGFDPMAVLYQHKHRPVPDMRRYRPEVSTLVTEVISRGLAKDPAERPESAADYARLLTDVRAHPGVTYRLPTGVIRIREAHMSSEKRIRLAGAQNMSLTAAHAVSVTAQTPPFRVLVAVLACVYLVAFFSLEGLKPHLRLSITLSFSQLHDMTQSTCTRLSKSVGFGESHVTDAYRLSTVCKDAIAVVSWFKVSKGLSVEPITKQDSDFSIEPSIPVTK